MNRNPEQVGKGRPNLRTSLLRVADCRWRYTIGITRFSHVSVRDTHSCRAWYPGKQSNSSVPRSSPRAQAPISDQNISEV
jgi:hypothetical protein